MTALPLLTGVEDTAPDEESGLGALRTARGNLPLIAVDIDARITGLVHATRVRQTFGNPHDEPIEAEYVFPLPGRAAVTSFRMTVGDRVIEGELQDRAQARRAYEEALDAGKRAAIAEEDRPNVFSVRVGNLMPGDRATVELGLAGPLALDAGEATWRFPLVVAPRYIPGTSLAGAQAGNGTAPDTDAVPDASRISPPVLLPGFPNPVALGVTVALDPAGGLPVTNLRTSVPADIDGTTIIVHPGQHLDRDLLVRFDVAADAVTTSAVAHDGTFALTLVPPRHSLARPRDVAFVLDRSGSMEGWKMTAARRAVARMIDTLGPDDRFAVLAFDHTLDVLTGLGRQLCAATDRLRFRAVEFLAGLDARGGTEMLMPLTTAAGLLAGDEPSADTAPASQEQPTSARERVLVLVTDGQVGNEDQILAALGPELRDTRVFAVGIDTAVNDAFLARLAALGGGACELVESEDRLDEVMERIHRRIGTPVLTGVRITGDGFALDPAALTPTRIGALHAGAPVTVYGRYAGEAAGSLRVDAIDAAGQAWSSQVAVTAVTTEALTPLWARGRVRDLEDQYAVRPSDDIEREIIRTSLDGHVLSRFTAYVALEATVVNEGGKRRTIMQPVHAPAGWDMFDTPIGGAVDWMSADTGSARLLAAMPVPMAPPPPMAEPAPGGRPAAASAKRTAMRRPMPRGRAAYGGGAAAPLRDNGAPIDLTAYRVRARRLVERSDLEASMLRRELADLIEDLRSVGVPEAHLADLVALLAVVDAGEWSGDVTALRAFADETAPERDRPFWKR